MTEKDAQGGPNSTGRENDPMLPRTGMTILERLILALIDGYGQDNREKRFETAVKAITGKPPVRRLTRGLPGDRYEQAIEFMAAEHIKDLTNRDRWSFAKGIGKMPRAPEPKVRSDRELARIAEEKFFANVDQQVAFSNMNRLRELFSGSYQKKVKSLVSNDVDVKKTLLFGASEDDDVGLSLMIQTLERIASELEKYGVPILSEDIEHLREIRGNKTRR